MHEINFLERRNKAGLVKFTDIASPDYWGGGGGGGGVQRGLPGGRPGLGVGSHQAPGGQLGGGEGLLGVGLLQDEDQRQGGAGGDIQEEETDTG